VDIGESFLNDAEHGEFEFFIEAAEFLGDVDADGDAAAFGEQFGVRSDGGDQAGFLQQRRVEESRDEADFANGGGSEVGGSEEQFVNLAMLGGHPTGDFGEGHLQTSQSLRGGFVEFAADAALFLGADGEQLIGEAAQIGLGIGQGGKVTQA
jgi:hypothetical protein